MLRIQFPGGQALLLYHLRCEAVLRSRSNPDGMYVNVNCLDGELPELDIVEFDGQEWEANAASLAHKSKEA